MAFPLIYFLPAAGIAAGCYLYKGIKKTASRYLEGKNKNSSQKSKNIPLSENQLQTCDDDDTYKNVNQDLVISTAAMGAAGIGTLFYPPLLALSIPAIIYLFFPVFKKAYIGLRKEKKIKAYVLYSISMPGILITGHIFLASTGVFFYCVSEKMLSEIIDSTRKKLIDIFGDQPENVWLVKDGVEIEVPFDSLKQNDVIAINSGETIPADGIIVQGAASVNQYILTGESQLTEKGVGSQVFASTMVLAGKIHVEVKQSGDQTVVAQITETLNKTVDYKMNMQSWGETISDNLAMPVLAVGVLSLPFTGVAGSLAILYVGIGDSIRILAPLSLLNYLRIASKNRLLIKDGRSLELLNDIDTVVFDKTGTLTTEQPYVKNIYSCNDYSELEVLQYAAWAEYRQTHPIARAILEKAKEHELDLSAIEGTIYEVGYGIKGKVSNALIRVGSVRFMKMERIEIPDEIKKLTEDFQEEGYSSVMVAKDDHLVGVLELHNTVRPEVEEIFNRLHENNITIYILSGDHEKPTRKMAESLNADNFFAEVFPEQKADIIEQLQEQGRKVCFIGDGINDTIAMKKANVSVSLSGASTIATDTAEIILMDGTLKNIGLLFDIAGELKDNVKTGFFTTLIPSLANISGIFLLHSGIGTAIVLDNVGLTAGVINSFLPVMRHKKDNMQEEDKSLLN